MKIHLLLITFSLTILAGCSSSSQEIANTEGQTVQPVKRDLDDIKEDGKLKVITIYSGTSYFLYKGQPMGMEYEYLQRFAEHMDLELEFIVANDIDELFTELNDGTADLIAHGLTITEGRKKIVDFTNYFYLTKQVLVQKKPDNWRNIHWSKLKASLIHDPIELIGDTVSVRVNSAYMARLDNLSEELGGEIVIDTMPGKLSTDKIIKKVVDGEIKYTVADKNIAVINASYYPILDISVPVSFSQRIAWAVRKTSPQLLQALNSWLDEFKEDVDYYVIYNKYFENKRNFRKRVKSDFYSLNKEQISKYDQLIQENAEELGWDWRLLASQVYQESRFDPYAKSWAGASGLLQLMPATAKELGVRNRQDPRENIEGATDYLETLYGRFDEIEDSVQRIKFAMASFNCGYGHVRDAQRLAKKKGLDPEVWDDNVEQTIVDLSYPKYYSDPEVKYGYVRGIEPQTYVHQIFERYDHYQQFIGTLASN